MRQPETDRHFYAPKELLDHGIRMPAPEAVYVERAVPLVQIARTGVTLHPGTRIEGERTRIAAGAEIGTHGSVLVKDAAIGRKAKIAGGSIESAVLLDGASLGPDAHVRGGTLLEEGASTAHAVGLKQTILLAYATLGSLINFCDCLLSGGRSRKDHSEVGSGFIHFNFTPFGPQGDKATPSIFGGVPRGVLMRSDRIFLGGSGGVVGPVEIGFGTVLAAGFAYRRDYGPGMLVYGEEHEARAVPFDAKKVRRIDHKLRRSLRYIGHLLALRAWYTGVRIAALEQWIAVGSSDVGADHRIDVMVLESAVRVIDEGVRERIEQVDRLFENRRTERGAAAAIDADERAWRGLKPVLTERTFPEYASTTAALRALVVPTRDHLAWVASLNAEAAETVENRLGGLVQTVESLYVLN